VSCSSSTSPSDVLGTSSEVEILISGQEYYKDTSNKTYRQAKYWKYYGDSFLNGESTVLSNGPTWGHNCSIEKYQGDVYSAGYVQGSTSLYDNKKLWINSTTYSVGDDTKTGVINEVAVDDGVVYLCGYEEAENATEYYDAKLWVMANNKEITSITLSTSPNIAEYEAHAMSLCFDKNNIYIAGYEGRTMFTFTAMLWTVNKTTKVVTSTVLDSAFSSSLSVSIFPYGDNIYICGSGKNSGSYKATYWYTSNGNKGSFSRGLLTNSNKIEHGQTISVVNGNVYVFGYDFDNANPVLKYWKNGAVTYLTSDTDKSVVGRMFVTSGENIYVVSSVKGSTYYSAYCWKNGVKTALSDGKHDVLFSDIFVTEK